MSADKATSLLQVLYNNFSHLIDKWPLTLFRRKKHTIGCMHVTTFCNNDAVYNNCVFNTIKAINLILLDQYISDNP